MISLQKWARLTGRRQPDFRTELPEDQLVISSDVARMVPPFQGVAGGNSFFDVELQIDPPAGGIAANGVLLNIPNGGPDPGIQTGTVASDRTAFFLPGIYSIRFEMRSLVGLAGRKGARLAFIPATGFNFPWGNPNVQEQINLYFNTAQQLVSAVHRVYMPVRWCMELQVASVALVDADVFNVHVAVDNEYLLDEIGSYGVADGQPGQ